MNRRLIIHTSTGDTYTILLRAANIVSITRNNDLFDTPYDDLPWRVREELLIAILNELAKD